MFTIKQLEAIYWVNALGGFEIAADHLHVTQSTISKRIAELEEQFAEPLFHRTRRKPTLTTQGSEVAALAEQVLRLNDQLRSMTQLASVPSFRFHFGVTDLVALSWMPELLAMINERHPTITLEPQVDLSAMLLHRLEDRQLDFVVGPLKPEAPEFQCTSLGLIDFDWMCSPHLISQPGTVDVDVLLAHTLLIQSTSSVLWPALRSVIENPALTFRRRILCNNMTALGHLAARGLGVTILPTAFFRNHIADGRLRIVETRMQLPHLEYYAIYRKNHHSQFSEEVTAMCVALSDFRRP